MATLNTQCVYVVVGFALKLKAHVTRITFKACPSRPVEWLPVSIKKYYHIESRTVIVI